jgi:hypothetical protein
MMTSDAKRALAKTIRELREKIILPDLREATERRVSARDRRQEGDAFRGRSAQDIPWR